MEVGWCDEWSKLNKELNAVRSAWAARCGAPEQLIEPDASIECLLSSLLAAYIESLRVHSSQACCVILAE
jgi:hypothetical protein